MQINTWNITERAVYEGILMGLGRITAEAGKLAPEQVADVLHQAVMNELQLIIDFSNQPVDLMAAAQQLIDEYEMSQTTSGTAEPNSTTSNPPLNDGQ